ncbi:MAG: OmpA family protein [Pseudomonadota bacterium]
MTGVTMTMRLGAVALVLAGCGVPQSPSATDRTQGGELVDIPAATWVDPDGCEHWVFDTGIEGFITPKLQRDGRPVCSDTSTAAASASEVPGPLTFGIVQGLAGADEAFVLSADATFDVDSAVVKPDAFRDLDVFFRFLEQEGFRAVLVEGYTDSTASEDYNLDLSLRRALAVATIAEGYGLEPRAVGKGEAAPRARNDTERGRAANRRVELRPLR